MTRTLGLVLGLAGSVFLMAGCDSGEPGGGDGGGMDASVSDAGDVDAGDVDAGDVDAGTPPDAGDTGDAAVCVRLGATCTSSAECCTGLSCGDDGGGGMVCSAADSCAIIGDGCSGDGDCCSNACDAGTCAENAMTSCDPIGEACTAAGECCSERCADAAGAACTGGADCRCAFSSDCRASDELCRNDGDCCVGLCDRPGGATVGTCISTGSCGVAGEPCSTEGLSGACCSTACLDADGTGTPTCQRLGGCILQDEACTTDATCCSGTCEDRGTSADGRPIRRCANADSCLPPGEVCGDGGASSNCCPNGGGDTGCVMGVEGIRRCLGGSGSCTLPAEVCTSPDDCCLESFPTLTCAAGPSGANVCCLPDGEVCATGSTCCSGICVPDTMGVLRCGSMCLADGDTCTTDADCCGCGCVSDGMGSQVCTSDTTLCAPCTDAQLGEFCSADSDCCNPGAVRCATEIEFSTCVLRR